MKNTRSYEVPTTVPITVKIALGIGRVRLTAEDTTTASVNLHPADPDDRVALKLIADAAITDTGRSTLRVVDIAVPNPPSATTTTVRFADRAQRAVNAVFATRGSFVISHGDGVASYSVSDGVVDAPGAVLIDIIVPIGSRVALDLATADFTSHGVLAKVEGDAGGGDVSIETGNSINLTSRTGDISVRYGHDIEVRTGSGSVDIGAAGVVRATTGSGDVTVGEAADVQATTGTGDVRIATVDHVRVTTGSGDVTIRRVTSDACLQAGTGDINVSSRDARVEARTGTGDIDLTVTAGSGGSARLDSGTGGIAVHGANPANYPVRAHSITGDVSYR